MNVFLFAATFALIIVYFASAISYLFINIFSLRTDGIVRSKTLEYILKLSIIFLLVSAFFTGLLTNGENIEGAIKGSRTLYIIIAIVMLVTILVALLSLIFRSASKKSGVPASAVKIVIKYSLIGEVVSVLLAWLLG